MDIIASVKRYEDWLTHELGGELVRQDLKLKRDRMAKNAFLFLRATYWRWAECAPALLDKPVLRKAGNVLAVGDTHLENYGTWRDGDGRLVWGVNDYDEAAAMPWTLDLVRLVASALLSRPEDPPAARRVAKAVLKGYGEGVEDPRPAVLDQQPGPLRELLERSRPGPGDAWWDKLQDELEEDGNPGERWLGALRAALPAGAVIERVARRNGRGSGSLARPRWVAVAEWRGGKVAREAKAVVPSGWVLPGGRGPRALRCEEAATGRYRVPDPWFRVTGHVLVRRLGPQTSKIERKGDEVGPLLEDVMLAAMGRDLAALHRASLGRQALARQLAALPAHWLPRAAETMARWVEGEFATWQRHHLGAG